MFPLQQPPLSPAQSSRDEDPEWAGRFPQDEKVHWHQLEVGITHGIHKDHPKNNPSSTGETTTSVLNYSKHFQVSSGSCINVTLWPHAQLASARSTQPGSLLPREAAVQSAWQGRLWVLGSWHACSCSGLVWDGQPLP